jgi:hypothetical protein
VMVTFLMNARLVEHEIRVNPPAAPKGGRVCPKPQLRREAAPAPGEHEIEQAIRLWGQRLSSSIHGCEAVDNVVRFG